LLTPDTASVGRKEGEATEGSKVSNNQDGHRDPQPRGEREKDLGVMTKKRGGRSENVAGEEKVFSLSRELRRDTRKKKGRQLGLIVVISRGRNRDTKKKEGGERI